jgi:hypothetical protein
MLDVTGGVTGKDFDLINMKGRKFEILKFEISCLKTSLKCYMLFANIH